MAKTNDSKWLRALGISIVVTLSTTAVIGCAGETKPCTCECSCAVSSSFCEDDDGDLVAGTPACQNTCRDRGTDHNQCNDSSRTDIPPPPPPPPPEECSNETPGLWISFLFCQTCPDPPVQEKDFWEHGCTFEDAEERAEAVALMDGEDCTVEPGSCTGE